MAHGLVDVRILQREYLLAISRAVTAELDLQDVLSIILRAAVELVAGKAGMIALNHPELDNSLRVAAVYGIPIQMVDHFAPLLHDIPPLDANEQEAELTRRLQTIARRSDLGFTQMVRLPMVSGGKTIGLIYVFLSGTPYHLPKDAASLLASFAEQAAIAVKNARLYEQVNKEKQRLDAIIQQNADGVMILDQSLRITDFNKALSQMVGCTQEKAIGQSHEEIFQWLSLKSEMDLHEALTNGWPLPGGAHLYVEGDLQRPFDENLETADGKRVSLGVTYAPLMDGDGRMTDIIANVRDLTRYREEEALQKTFISVVSHELKTPVSIIKGYAGTLRRQDANWSPEIIQDSLAVIEEEADNLTDLIDSLLEVSRLQAGTFSLEVSEDVQLNRVVANTARKFGNQSDKHTIKVQFADGFPPIWGDERRLGQVMNNLLSNAIKYSPDGGEIVVRGEIHPQHVTVSVQDSGIGIPDHEQHRIFQKFSRLDNALSRKTEGTGLGLFLCKAIIEAHNGRIWFHKNPVGPGITFTFSLPRN
ncbi:MAG: histidine kinase [Ardenticatenaceae bacterium]|nr:MAG: histidine kinase [Ardenticatenaceae bacterium]